MKYYAILLITANGVDLFKNSLSGEWVIPMSLEWAQEEKRKLDERNARFKAGVHTQLVELDPPQLFHAGTITRADIESKLHTEVQVNWDGEGYFALPMGALCESDDGETFTVISVSPQVTRDQFRAHGVVVS